MVNNIIFMYRFQGLDDVSNFDDYLKMEVLKDDFIFSAEE